MKVIYDELRAVRYYQKKKINTKYILYFRRVKYIINVLYRRYGI